MQKKSYFLEHTCKSLFGTNIHSVYFCQFKVMSLQVKKARKAKKERRREKI
jgi:hypothetical protein